MPKLLPTPGLRDALEQVARFHLQEESAAIGEPDPLSAELVAADPHEAQLLLSETMCTLGFVLAVYERRMVQLVRDGARHELNAQMLTEMAHGYAEEAAKMAASRKPAEQYCEAAE